MAESNPSLALNETQELTGWCMPGFLGLQISMVLGPDSVDDLVISLGVEKYVNITDPYEESLAYAAEALGIRCVYSNRCWLP